MEFKIEKNKNPNISKYFKEDVDIAFKFSKKVYHEFGTFIKALVLFGSVVEGTVTKNSDIDILIIVDDVSMQLTPQVVEAYRIITESLVRETSPKIHVTTLKLTHFWDYIKNGDPIGLNMLRDGVALIDSGFFDPLRVLLEQGRIRPSRESVNAYSSRAQATLSNANWHTLQATLDLYWAVIDIAHAALMHNGVTPPNPANVSKMLDEKLVKTKKLDVRYVKIMDVFYKLSKDIVHKKINEISGRDYDKYELMAKDFVKTLKKLVR